MSSQARLDVPFAGRFPRLAILGDPTVALVAAGVLSAMLVGAGLAADLPIGIALLIVLCYVPLVLIDLPVGLALWIPLMFFQGIPALNLGGQAAGLLIVVAWFGNLRSLRATLARLLRRHRRLMTAAAGLLLWLTLSLAWADDPGLTGTDLSRWVALALLFIVVATTLTTATSVRLAAYAFVAGATLSIVSGVLDGSLTSAVDGAARFEGGGSDPNFLASSIVAAVVLACALIVDTTSAVRRALLLVAIAMLMAGLLGSASRGGTLAAAVTIVAAFVVFKRRRVAVFAATVVLVSVSALVFTSAPATWERVTDFDNDNGRSDLWYVAWEMGKDNPLQGVGLGNFRVHSADYVQEPGEIESVENIVETPHFAHNTYLQLFAEGGIVALALFLVVIVGCIRACRRAAERFESKGENSLATLARAVTVATLSMLAAATFLSAGLDLRLWLLLGLGPALLTIASRMGGPQPEAEDDDPSAHEPPAPFAPRLGSGI